MLAGVSELRSATQQISGRTIHRIYRMILLGQTASLKYWHIKFAIYLQKRNPQLPHCCVRITAFEMLSMNPYSIMELHRRGT